MARLKQNRRIRPRKKTPRKSAEVIIDHVGARGDGLARVGASPVYVPYTAPGDRVLIEYTGARGRITEILEAGSARVDPPCPEFGTCGGCALQHVDDEYYNHWKRQIIVDALAREGFDADIVDPVSVCAVGGRRRASFAIHKTRKDVAFGFHERGSTRIVDLDHCLVLDPVLQEAIPDLRLLARALGEYWRRFDMEVTLCDNGIDVAVTGDVDSDDLQGVAFAHLSEVAQVAKVIRLSVAGLVVVAFETPYISLGEARIPIAPGTFLQASRDGEARLVQLVCEYLEKACGAGANRIADLFSGCGTFSLPTSRMASVDAFDSDGTAISALDQAARAVALKYPVKPERRNLFERPLMAAELKNYQAVVVDPPRAGAQAQMEELALSNVPMVVAVSCNPASFARDAAILREGSYALSQVTPVDQFVYAPHVELVGLFTKG